MINSITFKNFRNYEKREFNFGEGVTFIVSANATGKTNILEGIYFLSTGKSFKAKKEEEMIKNGAEIANVSANLISMNNKLRLSAVITRGVVDIGKENLERVPKKRLLVNEIPRRVIDFAGNLKTTLFLPEDMDIVTGSPSKRRAYLDQVISQVDRNYRKSVLIYERGVRQRNKLLWRIREEGLSRSHLLFWNQLLIKNGNYITDKRNELIEYINSLGKCHLEYDSSAISEGRLEQYKKEEIASATTLVGPHRDDFKFLQVDKQGLVGSTSRDLASFGSRGQQRMEVLYLKIAELKYIEEKTKTKPILLLDDIFSELDHEHREIVMNSFNNHQVIITSADEHNLPNVNLSSIKIVNL